ncbi:hypothetical protein T439DRAFT_81730 [Meredithblackwellia eburnea MCA 4105]
MARMNLAGAPPIIPADSESDSESVAERSLPSNVVAYGPRHGRSRAEREGSTRTGNGRDGDASVRSGSATLVGSEHTHTAGSSSSGDMDSYELLQSILELSDSRHMLGITRDVEHLHGELVRGEIRADSDEFEEAVQDIVDRVRGGPQMRGYLIDALRRWMASEEYEHTRPHPTNYTSTRGDRPNRRRDRERRGSGQTRRPSGSTRPNFPFSDYPGNPYPYGGYQ